LLTSDNQNRPILLKSNSSLTGRFQTVGGTKRSEASQICPVLLNSNRPVSIALARGRALAERRNLVFILTDRQRFDTMRCYGNDWIQTPHLNALAEQSVVFEHAYVTQPVCAPARSSIMTGLYPHASGVPRNQLVMPDHVQTLAEMVSDEYYRGHVGKWHLGNEIIRQHGFNEWVSFIDTLWRDHPRTEHLGLFSDYHEFLLQKGLEPDLDAPGGKIFSDTLRGNLPVNLQMASFVTSKAVDFIERNSGRPFILYVSLLEPHPPFARPHKDVYDPATLPVDPTFLKKPKGASLFNRVRSDYYMSMSSLGEDAIQESEGYDLTTETGWRRLRANYFGNVTPIDNAVGNIVGALGRTGIADDTAIVFTSEHGDMMGSHAMLNMRNFYEAASRIPLLIRVPWLMANGTMIPGNFSQIDLVPTLLGILGEPVPDHLQGVSRAEVLQGDATLEDSDVVIQLNGLPYRDMMRAASSSGTARRQRELINHLNTLPRRSIVTADRWKLNLSVADEGELFDLNADPNEFDNLFANPSHQDRIRHMAVKLRLWQNETGDSAPLPSV
jgi:arylsulfatase A-like enzyme